MGNSRRSFLALAPAAFVEAPPARCASGTALARPAPLHRVTAVGLANAQISFERDGKEIARYHYGAALNRPFVFPVFGPSGRMLTGMIHPAAPQSHSHHTSVWLAYQRAGGIDFWTDTPGPKHGRIVHRELSRLEDGDERAAVVTRSDWITGGGSVLLRETRETAVQTLPAGEWILIVALTLQAAGEAVALEHAGAGQGTGYGPIGVRVAKSMSVQFGGGRIVNSEGRVGERDVFRKPARWVDYSGPVAPGVVEGLALFDHPCNPGHPAPFHVREDGWMGAMLPMDRPTVVDKTHPLQLRYGLFVHGGPAVPARIDACWRDFARPQIKAARPGPMPSGSPP